MDLSSRSPLVPPSRAESRHCREHQGWPFAPSGEPSDFCFDHYYYLTETGFDFVGFGMIRHDHHLYHPYCHDLHGLLHGLFGMWQIFGVCLESMTTNLALELGF